MVTTEHYTGGTCNRVKMLPATRLSAIVAASLLLVPLAATTMATSGGDCASGTDAGDSASTALQITPSIYCEFTIEAHPTASGHDYFAFELDAAETAHLVYIPGFQRALTDPAGQPHAMTNPITTVSSGASGTWTLHFWSLAGAEPRDRAFGLYLNKSHFEGQVLVGGFGTTHGFEDEDLEEFDGVNGILGPDQGPVVDGQWFDLPATTTGIEMLFATSGDPSVWFYDEDGKWIDYPDCGFATLNSCRAPPGAVRVLVTDNGIGVSSPVDDLRFAFDLYW